MRAVKIPRKIAALLAGWILASRAVAGAPDYDAFCARDGNITTARHGLGLMAMLQASGQLEAIYEDASKGNTRARRVFEELETSYFPDIGRELAEKVSRPPCLLPAVRELSGWCVPSWSFLDFLDKGKPAGARLRKALFNGYAERARQRNLENQLILSAMNALIGVSVAATVIREGEVAGSGSRLRAPVVASDLRSLSFTERDLQKGLRSTGPTLASPATGTQRAPMTSGPRSTGISMPPKLERSVVPIEETPSSITLTRPRG
jgi:hypothetical protein